jgi:hypothetical protein
MDAPPPPPSQLANRIIRQFVDHLFGEDMIMGRDDFLAVRTVYRQRGGTWQAIDSGSKDAIDILEKVVVAWGQMPGRKLKSQEGI